MNLEDSIAKGGSGLVELSQQLRKIKSVMDIKRELGSEFFLNARVDSFHVMTADPKKALDEAIRRGNAYAEAGSDCIFYLSLQSAEIIGTVIGKKLRFVDESPEQARARRVREGVPLAVIESILAIGAYQRAGGKTVTITNTIADLTGRPPRTVAEFVQEHASVFHG